MLLGISYLVHWSEFITYIAVADLRIYTTFNDIQYYCDNLHCGDMLLYDYDSG